MMRWGRKKGNSPISQLMFQKKISSEELATCAWGNGRDNGNVNWMIYLYRFDSFLLIFPRENGRKCGQIEKKRNKRKKERKKKRVNKREKSSLHLGSLSTDTDRGRMSGRWLVGCCCSSCSTMDEREEAKKTKEQKKK